MEHGRCSFATQRPQPSVREGVTSYVAAGVHRGGASAAEPGRTHRRCVPGPVPVFMCGVNAIT
jgi:hypothetical protein